MKNNLREQLYFLKKNMRNEKQHEKKSQKQINYDTFYFIFILSPSMNIKNFQR